MRAKTANVAAIRSTAAPISRLARFQGPSSSALVWPTAIAALAIYLVALTVEVTFYAAVTTLMATGPVRRRYIAAKTWIDRIAGGLIGALGVSLILRH